MNKYNNAPKISFYCKPGEFIETYNELRKLDLMNNIEGVILAALEDNNPESIRFLINELIQTKATLKSVYQNINLMRCLLRLGLTVEAAQLCRTFDKMGVTQEDVMCTIRSFVHEIREQDIPVVLKEDIWRVKCYLGNNYLAQHITNFNALINHIDKKTAYLFPSIYGAAKEIASQKKKETNSQKI